GTRRLDEDADETAHERVPLDPRVGSQAMDASRRVHDAIAEDLGRGVVARDAARITEATIVDARIGSIEENAGAEHADSGDLHGGVSDTLHEGVGANQKAPEVEDRGRRIDPHERHEAPRVQIALASSFWTIGAATEVDARRIADGRPGVVQGHVD